MSDNLSERRAIAPHIAYNEKCWLARGVRGQVTLTRVYLPSPNVGNRLYLVQVDVCRTLTGEHSTEEWVLRDVNTDAEAIRAAIKIYDGMVERGVPPFDASPQDAPATAVDARA
jgi:hypothetical protein